MSERDSISAQSEKLGGRFQKGNRPHTYRHGESKTRLHGIWASMLSRCRNPKDWAYHNYGGRGITVCDEWRNSYEAFRDWAHANGYDRKREIDRIENDRGYSPDNCRFVPRLVNASNRRNNTRVVAFGETKTLSQWTRDSRCVVKRSTLGLRLQGGWPAEMAITTPAVQTNKRPPGART